MKQVHIPDCGLRRQALDADSALSLRALLANPHNSKLGLILLMLDVENLACLDRADHSVQHRASIADVSDLRVLRKRHGAGVDTPDAHRQECGNPSIAATIHKGFAGESSWDGKASREGLKNYHSHSQRVPEVIMRAPRWKGVMGPVNPCQAWSKRRVHADRRNSRRLPRQALHLQNSWQTSRILRVVVPASCSGTSGIRLSGCRKPAPRNDDRIPGKRTQRWAWKTPDGLLFISI
jgi:hypothetical protein